MLDRRLYLKSPGPGIAPWHNAAYLTPRGPRRVEIFYHTTGSDEDRDWVTRESIDNGRTWSELKAIPNVVEDTEQGGIARFFLPPRFHPITGDSYRFTMIRHWPGRKVFDYRVENGRPVYTEHVFVSENGGRDRLLRYEDGPAFDPRDPFNAVFFGANTAYYSHFPAWGPHGEVYYTAHCFGKTDADHRRVCLFRRDPATGEWRESNLEGVTAEQSSVGLQEPEVVRLNTGRLMIVARGNSTAATTGAKWISTSSDGGTTISPFTELRYDDGTLVHSPCSIHRFLRSTRNGRLYWLANIHDQPSRDQEPRYPLCIAQIDEDKAAVFRGSVEVLDDRRPGEPDRLQLSNFTFIEDRESLNFEIYVTLLGLNPDDFWGSDIYRYVYEPRQGV